MRIPTYTAERSGRGLVLFCSFFFCCLWSCKKDDELTKSSFYRDLVYKIQTNESGLAVSYWKLDDVDTINANLQVDTIFANPGVYSIPVTVLKGVQAKLFGMSEAGGDFKLIIAGDDGSILAQTDTIPLDPANSLHPDRYIGSISIIP